MTLTLLHPKLVSEITQPSVGFEKSYSIVTCITYWVGDCRASICHYLEFVGPVFQGRPMLYAKVERTCMSQMSSVNARLAACRLIRAFARDLARGSRRSTPRMPPSRRPAVATTAPAANPADFVGSEACATCHADISKGFDSNPHTRIAHMHGGKAGTTCEGCHGPGKAHVDAGGDATKIFRFTKATSNQIDEKCLTCHKGNHASFPRSAHGEANVSCTNCHSVHNFKEEAHLLKASQPTLCYGCHTDVKPDFAKPFHHKVDEGLMNCSDCHNPHGTFQKKGLKTATPWIRFA